MRNQVCLFVYMLNAFLITLIYSLTQVDVFTGSLSIFVDCRGNQIEIVPIAVLFIVVFGFLLLIQFICMIVDRFNMLVNIAAKTPIFVNKVTPKTNDWWLTLDYNNILVVFSFLLLNQFICMIVYRFTALVHILASKFFYNNKVSTS